MNITVNPYTLLEMLESIYRIAEDTERVIVELEEMRIWILEEMIRATDGREPRPRGEHK